MGIVGSAANSSWEMRLSKRTALPSQRIQPNQSLHLKGTLRRSTWWPSVLHFPSSGTGQTLLLMHTGVLVGHRHASQSSREQNTKKTDPTPNSTNHRLSLPASEAQCRRENKQRSQPLPCHHVILTGDFLLAHRSDT